MPPILYTNIFLWIPLFIALWKGEWIYFTIALCLSISSPIYHYLREHNSKSKVYTTAREMDWSFAILSYGYMFYFIFAKVAVEMRLLLSAMLFLTIVFFFYGWKFGDYKKLHPWFHVVASLVSSVIVFMGV